MAGIGDAPRESLSDLKTDAAQAFDLARRYHAELYEIYQWYMPFRLPVIEQSTAGRQSEGIQRTNHLFDATGLSAAFEFAGNMQADWIPPHGEFFSIEPGPLAPEDSVEDLRRVFQAIARNVHASLQPVHRSVNEMFVDLFAGTGALLINPGHARYPIVGQAVPVVEIAMRDGPYGDPWWRWWKRRWRAGDIETIWPDGDISRSLGEVIRKTPNTTVEVTQVTIWRPKEQKWQLVVWTSLDEPDKHLWHEWFNTSPWITPRFFKVPGESMGRGLAHLGLPFVKTANKARELALTAAAFAVLGLWVRRNDGVFNPDTATMAPGKMWTVAATGGAMGPSIQRLDVPKDFQISSIVMHDEREQIRKVLLTDELPDQQDPVRSATEIAGRLRRYARMKGGAGTRLAYELIAALVERSIEILGDRGMLPSVNGRKIQMTVDNVLSQIIITSPAAAAQRADAVERATNWIQIIVSLLGPQAAMLAARVEELAPQMGRWLGVDEQFIRSKGERKQLQELVAQIAAQAQQAQKPPPTPDQKVQSIADGGGAQGMPSLGAIQ